MDGSDSIDNSQKRPWIGDRDGNTRLQHYLWAAFGFVMVGCGIVGVFLPIFPTTIFLIVAVWCFTKSCPAMQDWLMTHPRFGTPLTLWFEHGVIVKKSKRIAVLAIAVSYLLSLLIIKQVWVAIVVGVTLLVVAAFILTRPDDATTR